MDRQLAERMIGAAVLLTVLVLVVPALLDGGGDNPSARPDVLPPPVLEVVPNLTIRIEGPRDRGPPVPETRVPAPAGPPVDGPGAAAPPAAATAADPAPGADSAVIPAGRPVAPASPPSAPPPAASGTPAAPPAVASAPPVAPPRPAAPAGEWVVQLGSFANGANAGRLAGQVRARGFAASVVTTGTGSDRRYRVLSGAPTTRPEADRQAAAIKAAGFPVTVVRR